MAGFGKRIAVGLFAVCVSLSLAAQERASERQIQAFLLAIKANDFSFIGNMARFGLGPNARDSLGNNPLMMAIREHGDQMVLLMLEDPQWRAKGVINHENQIQENPLMLAALNGQVQVVRRLISLGAEVNRYGWAPLHYAATNGNHEVIGLLLERHAFIDAQSPNGTTPLMMAARFNHTEAAKLLLAAGADPTLTNEAGFTARDYAIEANNSDLSFVLELEEIAFQNKELNQTFQVDPNASLEEVVIQSGGSVVTVDGPKEVPKEVAPGGGAEVFQGIR